MPFGKREDTSDEEENEDCRRPPPVRIPVPHLSKVRHKRPKDSHDLTDIRDHYEAFEKSKGGILVHVSSQHSILDVLYGGDTGRPMPSWTYQTTPEVSVSDQQHTGRCWIFATLAVMGHVFRSQYGISNHRATFSEGYLGFWDLYEKARLFLHVAYDTKCMPLDDPSLCDLLKNGISDGGDYIFCLNLLDKYGVVPTEYYPNSSYGSMSTEALVTLINQVLRDNVITLRTTGDNSLIEPMLTNIFALLCMGLGTPPAPWKKLDWQIDQCEVLSQFAVDITPDATVPTPAASAELPPEPVPWRPAAPRKYVPPPGSNVRPPPPLPPPPPPPPRAKESSAMVSELLGSLDDMSSVAGSEEAASPPPPPSPVNSTATAVAELEDRFGEEAISEPPLPSSAQVLPTDGILPPLVSSEPVLTGILPPRKLVDIQKTGGCDTVDLGSASDCRRVEGFAGLIQRITPSKCGRDVPPEGSGQFFRETMPDNGCLLGGCSKEGAACRLSHTVAESEKRGQSQKPQVEESLSFDYTPREFYYRFLNTVRFVPVVCDLRFPTGTRIISNDANMYGGMPSLYLNVTIDDIEHYAVASLKRNIPIWFACDVKKQLTPEGGRMCSHTDRLKDLLPEPHECGTKLQEIQHFNAVANHALLISAVSLKGKKPVAWRIVNSWGDVGRNAGVFVACGDWFREHVYSINVVYDTLSREHKEDIDFKLSRPTIRLGPFDPSVI